MQGDMEAVTEPVEGQELKETTQENSDAMNKEEKMEDTKEGKENVMDVANEKRAEQEENAADQPSPMETGGGDGVQNIPPVKPNKEILPKPRIKKDRTKNRKQDGGKMAVGKKMKKGIFISYSPDGGFLERKLVCETVKQFKENDLIEDIWFDKDEENTGSPSWFSQRMEAVEKCRAAICFLSFSYFQCPVSVYELRCLLERHVPSSSAPPKVFLVLCEDVEIPQQYSIFLEDLVRLSHPRYQRLSLSEKASVIIGSLMEKVESYASIFAPHLPHVPDSDYTEEYKKKKLCKWSSDDLQSWLYHMGIREFYRQSFAEAGMDGFLLMSIMDQDMAAFLGIDSRVVRRKILQQIIGILEKEHKAPDSWHLRARTQKNRADNVYLVYDPADVRLAQNLKQDLKKKNLQVCCHEKLGQSKEEFLAINGPLIATAKHVIILLTEGATASPFIFHEVLFADWLGKSLVTVMFKNVWQKMRPSLKAVIGEFPAVDFETKMYSESMDILEHHIKPLRKVPGVVLEQTYLNRMSEGLKPLQVLAASQGTGSAVSNGSSDAKVFLSYQWDMHNKVQEIKRILENNGISCWVDNSPTIAQQRGTSGASTRSNAASAPIHSDAIHETLESNIQRNMKSSTIVLSCITPRYLQSDNGIKDLMLAEALHKPVIAVLLRFVAWPPDMGPSPIKKLLAHASHIDLSNDKLFKQNFHVLVERLRRFLNTKQ
ncbi:uncharacterized protein LOC119728850 [Patiria miniata]|uniref:SAM domain-containing protein n=1 Tax=Patiria miniata TaxID=46514 RepID=A0A913ZZX8_PATMI|nr:uncharacterized protein LOC119728850 [Patiria miniata]